MGSGPVDTYEEQHSGLVSLSGIWQRFSTTVATSSQRLQPARPGVLVSAMMYLLKPLPSVPAPGPGSFFSFVFECLLVLLAMILEYTCRGVLSGREILHMKEEN
ncbi:hypothetical protein MAPG_00298 [Magnaporthiopsis poae ATCC 64411]|uniref:Uncharacterized protein n=1 Tax=Magnaporthiopsis poae (strain ATCC 64411 / 73-15) TaxID=644358 RepID=A0A0C4DKM1_MAGP6|nr:hypothetical protein MAPG_00298 [Magnaporthiopsis poae ATCC 64411]